MPIRKFTLAIACAIVSMMAVDVKADTVLGSFEFTGNSLAFTDLDAADGITVSALGINSLTPDEVFSDFDATVADNTLDFMSISGVESSSATDAAFTNGEYFSITITNNSGSPLALRSLSGDFLKQNTAGTFNGRIFNTTTPADFGNDTIAQLGRNTGGFNITDDDFVNNIGFLDGTDADFGATATAVTIADGSSLTLHWVPIMNSTSDTRSLLIDNLTITSFVPSEVQVLGSFEFTDNSLAFTDLDAADGITVSDLGINGLTLDEVFSDFDATVADNTLDFASLSGTETSAASGDAFTNGEYFSITITNNSGSPLALRSLSGDFLRQNTAGAFVGRVFDTTTPTDIVADTIARLGRVTDNGFNFTDADFINDTGFLDGADSDFGATATAVTIADGSSLTLHWVPTMNSTSDTRSMLIDNLTLTSTSGATLGDFDGDGDVDGDDVDFYIGNLGQPATGDLAQLDLTGDGDVTIADHNLHVTTLVVTSNGVTGALLGDVNLDGMVGILTDALALLGGLGLEDLGQDATSRSQGDLNADGMVTILGDALILVPQIGQSTSP